MLGFTQPPADHSHQENRIGRVSEAFILAMRGDD
jgi:hypothetical protein